MRGYEARYDSWCSELARIDSQLPERPHVATLATRIPYQNKTTSLCTQNTHKAAHRILARISGQNKGISRSDLEQQKKFGSLVCVPD